MVILVQIDYIHTGNPVRVKRKDNVLLLLECKFAAAVTEIMIISLRFIKEKGSLEIQMKIEVNTPTEASFK